MRISVVIPVFNHWQLTRSCIAALRASTDPEVLAEIVVVDDASTDGVSAQWIAECPGIRPLVLPHNRGFSGACNAGAALCTGELILFLNNDALAEPGSLATMRQTMADDAGIGIVGARLLYSDGSLQHAGLALLAGPVSRWWHVHRHQSGTLPDANVARDFLAVTGAALLIRRTLFLELNGFDEGFVNGWEDVDLCLRAWGAGARVRYEPAAVLEHLESATLGRTHDHARNERRFVDRWEHVLADAPRYPLAEVPPIALAISAKRDRPHAERWALAHVQRWWRAHFGAAVIRTRAGSRLDRRRIDLLAAVARRLPTLEISWADGCLWPATGPRRVAFVAPRTAAEARRYAGARDVAAWWTPTEAARDLLVGAGIAPDGVAVVPLGTDTAAAAPRHGPLVVAVPAGDPALVTAVERALPSARILVLTQLAAAAFDAVDVLAVDGNADHWGLLVPAALGHGCGVIATPPLDALWTGAPGVTVGSGNEPLAQLVALADVDELRATRVERSQYARRRLDAYLATQRVSELARAITGGIPSSELVAVEPTFARRLRGVAPRPDGRPAIAAHLIVGRNEETFLPALLRSLEGVVDRVIVNDNSGDPTGPNARALQASAFARRGDLIVDRSPFVDFSYARNRTLALHRELRLGEWAAFVDADEVHRPVAATIARNLQHLPADVAIVDGYTRHYFQSFRLYTSIERRMTFFRVTPQLQWTGRVHERLVGVSGRHLAIPYVYDHYGAVFALRRQAAKGRQYSSLGQAGPTVAEADEASVRDIDYFRSLWPLALHYGGEHPPAVTGLRAELERRDGERYLRSERIAAQFQPPRVRLANLVRRANFEYRWRGRALDPRARALMRS